MSQEVYKVVHGNGRRGIWWSAHVGKPHALAYRLGKPTTAKFGGVLVFRNEEDARQHMWVAGDGYVLLRGLADEEIPLPVVRGFTGSDLRDMRSRRWVWRKPNQARYAVTWPQGTAAFKTFTPVEVL